MRRYFLRRFRQVKIFLLVSTGCLGILSKVTQNTIFMAIFVGLANRRTYLAIKETNISMYTHFVKVAVS